MGLPCPIQLPGSDAGDPPACVNRRRFRLGCQATLALGLPSLGVYVTTGEDRGQQIQLRLILEIAELFLAMLAAVDLLVDFALEHAGRQHFGLGHEAHGPLRSQRQGIFLHLQIFLSALGNAVTDHALEHLSSRKAKPVEKRVVLSLRRG